MPELPEVETMCRGIRPIVGCRVVSVARPPCRRRAISIQPRVDRFRSRAEGKLVVAVSRAGKRVVVWLADDQPSIDREISRKAQGRPSLGFPGDTLPLPGEEAIVFEPRMTGLVLLSEPPTANICGSKFASSAAQVESQMANHHVRNHVVQPTAIYCFGIAAGWAPCNFFRRTNSPLGFKGTAKHWVPMRWRFRRTICNRGFVVVAA